ncbi:endonuclease NucS domain-containing protein [Planctopirus hydrillae]|uniref:Nuclease n=1 Tax=Planctopirus hydrillae TaxID=1841610 RepID=A0A1C3ENZ3_9PLAN|nr:endonuclease NucS domain-containing protein [Planctopirus hydrillae]ODA34955.1 nuclease [Planctopirus hydrillae]
MPIQHAIWKIGSTPSPLPTSPLASEQQLEEMIVAAPQILSRQWMLIGRQEPTGLGGRIDLLAIAPDASLVLIELKRNRTPREVVAQALDYASWVKTLTADKIAPIYQRFSGGKNLNEAFKEHFGVELDEETLNESHQILLVAAELDSSTERIIGYLNSCGVAINVVFFQVFQHGSDKLLSRAWMIDPSKTQANVASSTTVKGEKERWNGEFYVSYGGDCTWEDARTYGFISAGGGSWYSQTLKLLSPEDRVWVKIPGSGYVGVGRVVESVVSVNDFKVQTAAGEVPCLEVLTNADRLRRGADDVDKAEHFVRVAWLDTLSADKAFQEIGLFGNQNTVCQPTTPKWRHTVERLKTVFRNWDGPS